MVTNEAELRPSAEDVARRLVILKYVVVYAVTAPPRDMLEMLFDQWSEDERQGFSADAEARREDFWKPLHQAGLLKAIASSERELAETTIVSMTPQQQINATWRMEAAQVLMWALELIPQLPPYDTQANHDLLKQIDTTDILRFVLSSRLRAEKEIDRARDDAELWHWRSRTRQLIEEGHEFRADEQTKAAGFNSYDDIIRFTAQRMAEEGRIQTVHEDFLAKGKAYRDVDIQEWSEVQSITMERHFALNWLCGYAPGNEWDETPTDT